MRLGPDAAQFRHGNSTADLRVVPKPLPSGGGAEVRRLAPKLSYECHAVPIPLAGRLAPRFRNAGEHHLHIRASVRRNNDFFHVAEGGTTLDAGTLELAGLGAAGTGAITFEAGAQTLRIDQAALDHGHLQNTINGFGVGDTIDLAVRPTSRRIAAKATIWCWTSAKATAATRPSCSITSGKLSQRPRTGTSSPET